jgi:hypothetical protein
VESFSLTDLLPEPKGQDAYIVIARRNGDPPGIGLRKEGVQVRARREKDGVLLSCGVEFEPSSYHMKSATFIGKVLAREKVSALISQ